MVTVYDIEQLTLNGKNKTNYQHFTYYSNYRNKEIFTTVTMDGMYDDDGGDTECGCNNTTGQPAPC